MSPALRVLATLAALLLAGCAGDAPEAADAARDDAAAPDVSFEEVPDVDAGASPHVHDYWSGRERVSIVDREYEITADEAVQWGIVSTLVLREPILGMQEVSVAEDMLVYEGAGQLDITVTWQDPTITGMRFLHRHAGSSEIQPWLDAPNGETLTIALTPDMTDMPHAQVSRWAFLFAAAGTPPAMVGAFHVKMDVVKSREVAEWPGHPDAWGAATERLVADADGSSRSSLGPVGFLRQDDPWGTPADAIPAAATVPMGTASLVVTVTVLGVDPAEMDVDHLHLLVRTAADLEFDFDEADAPNASEDRLTWTWTIPVDMGETDNPYAEESSWAFRVTAGYVTPVGPCDDGCADAELRYHLTAVAHKARAATEEEA